MNTTVWLGGVLGGAKRVGFVYQGEFVLKRSLLGDGFKRIL